MILHIHPETPQTRLIEKAAAILKSGGVLVIPTDSSYSFCCTVANHSGLNQIRRIREVGDDHYFTLMCRDLSELSTYALVNNAQYRFLRVALPGAYTFILQGSKDVPKKLLTPKRKTIGLRVPDYPITDALLEVLGEPLLTTTVVLPHIAEEDLRESYQIVDCLEDRIDAIIDAGNCSNIPTTVVDLTSGVPEIVREGGAPTDFF